MAREIYWIIDNFTNPVPYTRSHSTNILKYDSFSKADKSKSGKKYYYVVTLRKYSLIFNQFPPPQKNHLVSYLTRSLGIVFIRSHGEQKKIIKKYIVV